jgi:hypothetical protein
VAPCRDARMREERRDLNLRRLLCAVDFKFSHRTTGVGGGREFPT